MKKQFEIAFVVVISAILCIWLIISFYKAYAPKPHQIQGQIATREYKVSSKVAGRIGSVLVKRGDNVKKGDLIFTIESPELEAKLTQAKAGYEAAKAL